MAEGQPRPFIGLGLERPGIRQPGRSFTEPTPISPARSVRSLQAEQQAFLDRRPLMAGVDTPHHLADRIIEEGHEVREEVVWRSDMQPSTEQVVKVADELADVMSFVFNMSNLLGIDMQEAYERKMIENRTKYPADALQDREGVTFADVYPQLKRDWNAKKKKKS